MSSTSEYEPDNEPTPSDEAVSSDDPPAAKRRKSFAVADANGADDADDFDSPASSLSRQDPVKAEPSFLTDMPLTSNWEVNGDDGSDFEVVGVLGHTWERARALRREARRHARRSSGRASDREVRVTRERMETAMANGNKRRRYKNTKHKAMKEKVASRHDQTIVVETPRFGDDQVFASWDEFWSALHDFMATHFVLFRKRTSQTARKNNQNLENEVYAYVPFEIPEERFQMARMVYWCTHGCLEPARGSGKRTQNHLRFTGCLARFIAIVAKQPNGKLGIVVHDENATHNHQVNEEIYQHLKSNKIIPTDMLVHQVDILRKANAPIRHLTEFISSEVGQELSTQHVRNFIRTRFGGPSVEEKVRRFASDYTSISGNHCLVVQDSDDVMVGLVLVNYAQTEMYKRWGEVLLLDWTHHTNNRGFYLGELMVTAAHGKGVSVCEMLVLDQTKETMKRCLDFFMSLVDATKTETIIIDKDFTEWAVINESLPSAKVLFCQFHAIYAIQRALANPKYGINPGERKEIEIGFREAMHASTESEYIRRWKWLRKECQKACPHFGEYLQRNWDACRDMWATHARCQHFTACNTTNNRIEATWKQMKSMLNLTTSLDNCLAAILLYQNNTMTELRRELVDKQCKTWYDPKEPYTTRELGSALSAFGYNAARRAYASYLHHRSTFGARSTHPIVEVAAAGETFTVSFDPPSCTCSRFTECRILCAHMCYAALDVRKLGVVPASMIPERWNFANAFDIVHDLRGAIQLNTDIRSALLNSTLEAAIRTPGTPDYGTLISPTGRVERVTYVKLKKNERSSEGSIVRSDVEKYNMAMATMKPLMDALVESSTREFYPRLRLLEIAVKGVLEVLPRVTGLESVPDGGIAADAASSVGPKSTKAKSSSHGDQQPASRSGSILTASSEKTGASVPASVAQRTTLVNSVASRATLDQSVARPSTLADKVMEWGFNGKINDDNGSASDDEGDDEEKPPPPLGETPLPDSGLDKIAATQVQECGGDPVSQTPVDRNELDALVKKGALRVLRLPETVQTGKKNNQRLRKSSKKKLVNPRLSVVVDLEQWQEGVDIKRIVQWLESARNQNMVTAVFDKVPVVLRAIADMSRRILAKEDDGSAITSLGVVFSTGVVKNCVNEMAHMRKRLHKPSTSVQSQRLAVRVHHQLPFYQDTLIFAMNDYYNYLHIHRARAQAYTWLQQDWTSWASMFDNFAVSERADFQLAIDISSVLDVTSLTTLVELPGSTAGSCSIGDLIESLPGNKWLTDAPITVMLQWLCKQQRQSVFISSLIDEDSRWKLPLEPFDSHVYVVDSDVDGGDDANSTGGDVRIKEWEVAVSACHVGGNHWTLAIIDLYKREYIIYDPLNDDTWIDMTRERRVDVLLPAVEKWRRRVAAVEKYPYTRIDWSMNVLNGPIQGDTNSCGVAVLAVASSYMFVGMDDPLINFTEKLPIAETNLFRLRVLWHCLCAPGAHLIVSPPSNGASFARTEAELQRQLASV